MRGPRALGPRIWWTLGGLALAALLAATFRAYLHPDMVLEFTSFILCL